MKKIVIDFKFNGSDQRKVAVLSDNLTEVIKDHPDNQADEVHTGIADELGVWNIHFFTPTTEFCCDFLAEVDGEGNETLLLEPCDVLVWDKNGKSMSDKAIPFTVNVVECY